jgi:hypothetical protein
VTDPLPDAKSPLTDRRDRRHVDVLDVRPGRTVVTPRDDSVDRRLRSLELDFDRTVAAIAHPSRQTLGSGGLATSVTEEHSLDTPAHDDTHAHDLGRR